MRRNRIICKICYCGFVGTGISSGLALLFTWSLATDSMASVGSWTSWEVLHSPDIGLAGGTKLVGATPDELSTTGLVLAQNGSLLLRRCLIFLLKTLTSSVLKSYDLTSTCCSTRALYHRPDLTVGLRRTTSPLFRDESSLALILQYFACPCFLMRSFPGRLSLFWAWEIHSWLVLMFKCDVQTSFVL